MTTEATSKQQQSGIMTGLFTDKQSSESAYRSLRDRGYSDDDINVVMSDDTRKKYYANDPESELGSKAAEGTGVGGAIGGTLGAIIAGVAAMGTNLVLPGLGLVVWGPLAAALAGAGAGALTGGLVGALVGWGIPEDHAVVYENGIKNGGTVIGVKPRSAEDAAALRTDWETNRGQSIYNS
ncbi:MAG TPA: hypothetical protein VHQ01_10360 [Pyrinomonadaceae bacterium]|nr:hypothetical protein [Pyrinomonadaceae bacterium]